MSKSKKLLLVLLSACFAISLAFGACLVGFAEGEATEISWPSTVAASDWFGATEVRIPTNMAGANGGDLNPSAEMKAKVKVIRGSEEFACSHIYAWSEKITFYFNGSGYDGKNAQVGDVLSIDAGLAINNQAGAPYISTEAVSWTFDGTSWVMDTQLPDRDLENMDDMTIDSITTSDIIGGKADSIFYINTSSSNTQDFGDANYDSTYTMLPYLSFRYPNGSLGDVWYVRVNGPVARLFIHAPGTQSNININTLPEGGVLTIRAGFGILNTEALKEDVSFVYNGSAFVPLVEPDSFSIATQSGTQVQVGQSIQIEVDDDAAVTAYYRYSVSDPAIATISDTGLLTGLGEGTVTVSVWYGNLAPQTIELNIVALSEEDIESFSIDNTIREFYIPVSTAEKPTSFWQTVVVDGQYAVQGKYTLKNGTIITVDILEEELGTIDYTTAGDYKLTVTDDLTGMTAEIDVVVYDYTLVDAWDSVGVSGYDVNDERNAAGTWNGHMMISMNSYSTNTLNMTGSNALQNAVLKDMASYIVYQRADGTVYQNTEEDAPISLWELSSNILVMMRPNGYTGNMGYGVDKATGEVIPIYNQGDIITFRAGMPIYKFISDSTNTIGYYVVEGYLTKDYSYYCYEDNGTSSLWQLYVEYTDFTLPESIELQVDATASVGATRVPADATTGTFSYESSDTSVVTVSTSGNMVGIAAGTATITVTLTGGKDANGEALDPIVKTVTVTVLRGIQSVSGSGTIEEGATFDPSQFEVTVTYTDGETVTLKLNAEGVTIQDVDTSKVGVTEYNVMVTIDGQSKRGTFTLEVTEKGGCGSAIVGTGAALFAGIAILGGVAVLAFRKKKED